MPGQAGRSGRKVGSTSWWRNPVAVAGHYLNGSIEHWLACAPVRRHTVPPRVKRRLAREAIEHAVRLHPDWRQRPSVDQVLAWSRRLAPDITLRRQKRTDQAQRSHSGSVTAIDPLSLLARRGVSEKQAQRMRAAAFRDLVQRY